jgi:hypothetical protein
VLKSSVARWGRSLLLVLVSTVVATGAAPAWAAPCIGAAECPYTGVTVLDQRPERSPYAPAGVAVNHTTHDVYVADRYANAVKQYAQDGSFIRSWGGRENGRIDDIDQPIGISIDATGNVWTTSLNTNVVSEFEADGDILSILGTGQGGANGQYLFPEDVAVAPNGHVWVADTGNNRVEEFAADGSFLTAYVKPGPAGFFGLPSGTGLGEFNHPRGIAVAPNGDVYVADTFNHRLQRLPSGTTAWEAIGTAGGGSGPGDFLSPQDVVADPSDGTLYVTQPGRTQKRSAVGIWTDVAAEGGEALDYDAGKVFLVQGAQRRIRELDADTGAPITIAHPIEPDTGELRDPQATAVDGSGNLFVADTDADRIVKLNAATGAFIAAFGTQGSGDGQFNNPWGVAVDGAGNVYVADTNNNRIQEIDGTTGAFIAKWGAQGQGDGQFNSPQGVAVAADASLLVADAGNNRVQRTNPARDTWTVIGGRSDENTGGAVGEFYFASDVAVSTAGDVWVSDPGNHRVQKLPAGSSTWEAFGGGGSGTADGKFNYPRGIEVTADGAHVFVADTNNYRVQKLSGAGAFEAKWGGSQFGNSENLCAGAFNAPWGIAVASDGTVFVGDEGSGNVDRFTFGSGSIPPCDRTAPAVTGTAPANNASGVSASPTFTATGGIAAGDDAAIRVRVLRTSGAATIVVRTLSSTDVTGNTWTVPWSGAPLADGLYLWEAVQGDAEGNEAASFRRSFRVGPIPLAITQINTGLPVSGASPGSNPVIDDQTPRFAGTAANGGSDPTTITVHLDRYNGASFVPDVHTFTTTRDGNGNWVVTSPIVLAPETWQVRVTQGAVESPPFWFQLQTLAISQITDGTPVSGNPPGTNPVIIDTTPDFKGVAFSSAGASNTVTVHLDRWDGTTFDNNLDVHTFTTTRGPNGPWSATAPAIVPETWRVRVTQVVDGVTRTSESWWFQLQADKPLAITQLSDGVPVSGVAPGVNPLIDDSTPLFKGTASVVGNVSLTVHIDRWDGTTFDNHLDVQTILAARDANGIWAAQALELPPESYRVRVTQGGAESAGWFFQIRADTPLAVTQFNDDTPASATAPGPNPIVFDTTPTLKGTARSAPGKPTSVQVHFDRWNGSTFVNDIQSLDTTRDASGKWSVTPTLTPDSWRVRVTQGSEASASWLFQIKADTPLAVTHIDGAPVIGAAPGPNVELNNQRPTIKGTASLLPDLPTLLAVRLHKWNGKEFEKDAVVLLAQRDENGNWSATPDQDLGFESYAVQVAQASNNSPEWWFHIAPVNQAPGVTITAPKPGVEGHYKLGYSYLSQYGCTDDAGTPSCVASSDKIDTSSEGLHSFTVTSFDNKALKTERTVQYVVEPRPASDGIEVQGIEFTQGTQTANVENPETTVTRPGIPMAIRSAKYNGVSVVKKKAALARVFVYSDRKSVDDVDVYLYGYRNKKSLGDPLFQTRPNSGKVDQSARSTSDKQRMALGSHAFLIPKEWLDSTSPLDLVAVALPTSRPSLDYCPTECDAENGFALTGITPVTSKGWDFAMVHFKPSNGEMPSVNDDVFRSLELFPVPDQTVTLPLKYQGELPFQGGDKYKEMHSALWNWDQGWGADVWWNFALGVADSDTRNIESGTIFTPKKCFLGICSQERPVAVVSAQNRPLTAVGHEMAHGLGRGHAGCGDEKDTPEQIEKWPPDQKGYLQGVGADISAFARGDFIIYDGIRPLLKDVGKKKSDYDHMSYCADEDNAWVSPRGWEIMLSTLRNPPKVAKRSLLQASGKTLAVSSLVSATGAITTVGPGIAPMGDLASTAKAIVKNAAGVPIATVPVAVQALASPHDHPGDGASMLSTSIPSEGAASVTLTAGGIVLAERKRSPAAPTVAVVSPKKGATVGKAKTVEVAWKAADADGDKLTTRVEYSPDAGKHWNLITADQKGTSVALRRELFEQAKRAMVRVTVNDGWNEASATSAIFKALGSPPAVAIVTPVKDAVAATDSVLALTGAGQGEGRDRLKDSQLAWYDGKRLLGRGASVSADSLKPGTRTIRLVGTDKQGRTGSDTVKVKVRKVAPAFLKFSLPKKLGAKARKVKVKAAASMPSVLRIGKQKFTLGRRATTFTVKLKPGKGALVLALKLTGYGKTSKSTVTVTR